MQLRLGSELNLSLFEKKRVGVVGARGYSGLEVSRLLLGHPNVSFEAAFATSAFRLSDHLSSPRAADVPGLPTSELLRTPLDVVFLATPASSSIELAPTLLEKGVDVIDLSGAFRLKDGAVNATYKRWYGFDHTEADLVREASYGLAPWAKPALRSKRGGTLVANPGCFATAVLMGLLPLVKHDLIDLQSLVIDAKSGTTGAGKKAEERLLHAEVDGGCFPYRIGRHQHTPEIQQIVKAETGREIDPIFTTHLLNIRRGIVAGLYSRLNTRSEGAAGLEAAFDVYKADPLVDVVELNEQNESAFLNLRRVIGTARTRIGYRADESKLSVFVLIDNLMKGAASQAIENFNRLMDQPASTGLIELEGVI